jgi:hypothetical protein
MLSKNMPTPTPIYYESGAVEVGPTHVALSYDAEIQSMKLIGGAESLDEIKAIRDRWAAKGIEDIRIFELKEIDS